MELTGSDARGTRRTRPIEMVSDLVAMAALVVSGAGLAVALVALVYAGPLIDGRPRATASILVAAGLGAVWLALRSRIVPLVAVPQDAPAVVLVAMVASALGRNPELGVGSADWVMVLLALATLLSGILMWVLGRFGLGEAVRYLPTIVVNAFVAGTGWLLAKGGFDVMLRSNLGLDDLGRLVEASDVGRWLPGALLALVVVGSGETRRLPEATTSAVVVLSAIIFYLVVVATSSVGSIEDGGWLVGPFDQVARPAVVSPDMLRDFPLAEIMGSRGDALTLLVITVVALLLNLSALESTRGQRVDTSHELRQAGIANMALSPAGTIPIFHALGDSLLAEQLGVRRRVTTAGAGLVLVAFGLVGASAVGYIPVFIAGGLLIAVGVKLLIGWLRFLLGPIGWIDRMLTAAILIIIATVGILEGVVIGLVLACALFVFRYSRVDPIRRHSDLSVTRSRLERTQEQAGTLLAAAEEANVFELQGFLFFGSTTRLVDTVLASTLEAEGTTTTVVFDLRFVTGVEPGTAAVMATLFDELDAAGVDVMISGPDPSKIVAFAGNAEHPTYPKLESAVAAAEDLVLSRSVASTTGTHHDNGIDQPGERPWLDSFLQSDHEPGALLIAQGDPGDTMLFLLSGTCNAYSNSISGERHRVRQFTAPSWIGEIGFLRATPRSADIVAETAVTTAVIDRAGFSRLRAEDPALAADLLNDIATVAADRTASLTEALTRSLD